MKDLFPEYADPYSKDYSKIWAQALFVFDTNVLLNLYRYKPGTRDELLSVLERLSERIWIPHHVALEFQRNRLSEIANQYRQFSNVRDAIGKARTALVGEIEKHQLRKRQSLIDIEPLISVV